jgi:peptidyl-prolyl cis-trans isomerase B (cyclophilin B)
MRPPQDPHRLPFVIGAVVVLVAAAIAVAIAIDNADSTTPVGALTPTPAPTPSHSASPTATAAPTPIAAVAVPGTPCSSASFGAPLGPLGEPSDPHKYSAVPPTTIDPSKLYEVVLHTDRGDVTLCLEPKLAPITVNVIVTLVRNHFYDGIPFHRVCPNPADSSCGGGGLSIAQFGDPNCIGNVSAPTCGQGGPGFSFKDEPVLGSYTAGCVAMANSGANTNGSQIFICTGDDTSLPKSYNLFGVVSDGLNVAQALQKGDVISSATVQEQS